MTATVTQAFDLRAREDITPLSFVVRLIEEADRKLVTDHVIKPKVAGELPVILEAMRHTFKARADLERVVQGSGGSLEAPRRARGPLAIDLRPRLSRGPSAGGTGDCQ